MKLLRFGLLVMLFAASKCDVKVVGSAAYGHDRPEDCIRVCAGVFIPTPEDTSYYTSGGIKFMSIPVDTSECGFFGAPVLTVSLDAQPTTIATYSYSISNLMSRRFRVYITQNKDTFSFHHAWEMSIMWTAVGNICQ